MISVIIPILDNNLLKYTLDSLKSQSNQDFEVIVVEYGNSKNTKNICGDIQLHTSSNLNNARNTGIHHAKYDRIAFLGEGCVANPEWIDSSINISTGPVILATNYLRPNWLISPLSTALGEFVIDNKDGVINCCEALSLDNVFLTKEIYKKIGGFHSEIDSGYHFSKCLLAYDVYYNPKSQVEKITPDFKIDMNFIGNEYYDAGYKLHQMYGYWSGNLNEGYWLEKSKKHGEDWFKKVLACFRLYRLGYEDSFFNRGYSTPYDIERKYNTKYEHKTQKPTDIEYTPLVYNNSYKLVRFNELPKVLIKKPNSNKALCMIAPDEYSQRELEITEEPAKKYADKYGYDFVVLRTGQTEHKCGHKYLLNQVAEHYDNLLYIDCDVLIKDAPDIIDYYKFNKEWGMFVENDHLPNNIKRECVREINATMDCMNVARMEISKWWNGGVIVAPRNAKEIYFQPYLPVPDVWCVEQHWLNIMINLKGADVINIGEQWNTGWTWKNFPRMVKDAYFIHLNGCPQPLRLDFLKHFLTNNTISEELINKSGELKCPPSWA